MKEIKKEKENVTLEELQKISDTSEKLAREIRMISRAFKKIASGGLTREALVVLLHDSTKIGKQDINYLLNALQRLDEYTKPEKEA